MNDLGNLLQMIYDLLSGWLSSFTSYATDVMEKLNLIEEDTDSIVSNTSDIADNTNDIKDNTGAIITPVQSIKTNTDSIKNDTTNIKNNVSTMTNQLGTISTNVGTASAFSEDIANNTLDIKDKIVTIASDTTQIRSNTNTVVTDLDKVYEALKWSLMDKVTSETVEGDNSVSFDTDLTNDLVLLEVSIEGTQSGTGNPSPDNVRPITGITDKSIIVNGNNVTIALGQTVFNGILDAVSGKLTLLYAFYTFNGTEDWYVYSARNGFWINANNVISPSVPDNLCNRFIFSTAYGDFAIRIADNGTRYYFCNILNNITGVTDLASWKTWVSNNNIQIASKLVTPVEVQLTPSQIATIKGINTIITDGNISATYEESIKHYLDKQEA